MQGGNPQDPQAGQLGMAAKKRPLYYSGEAGGGLGD